MEDCLFCKIAAGQIPATVVYQDDDVFAFRDINPQAPHHILFIPKQHIATSMADLRLEDSETLAKIFAAAKKIAHELGLENGYRFVTNVGPDSGQSVFHLHFHLLGGHQLQLRLG
ncbi:MAG TPA: histidine triad nucleotide-binding protein [Dictyobacter sp.]|jgi:histidine triad (HIT) family protein|nr:histidine triad nucleotide-binding protein [Dictyobacter sp.]